MLCSLFLATLNIKYLELLNLGDRNSPNPEKFPNIMDFLESMVDCSALVTYIYIYIYIFEERLKSYIG